MTGLVPLPELDEVPVWLLAVFLLVVFRLAVVEAFFPAAVFFLDAAAFLVTAFFLAGSAAAVVVAGSFEMLETGASLSKPLLLVFFL